MSEGFLDFIYRMQVLDVKLSLNVGQLRYNAPKGVITDDILAQLKEYKPLLIQYLEQLATSGKQLDEPIPALENQSEYPLSFAQQRFWFLDQLAGGNSPIYNMLPIALEVDGPLRIKPIKTALRTLLDRHIILSNKFSIKNDKPVQLPGQPGDVTINEYDLSSDKNKEAEIARIILLEGELPFDLQKGGPMLRIGLIKKAAQKHILVLTLHHIVADGWSLGILVDEFSQLYQAADSGITLELPPLSLHYGDFAAWERKRLDDFLLKKYLHFWKKELAGVPHLLELPTDKPRPRLQSYNGYTHAFLIDPELSRKVNECAKQHGVTPFMILLSVFGILLGKYSRQEDLIIGSPLSVRVHPQSEPLIGLFLNTIPLRIDLSGNPGFDELLIRVKNRALPAYEHGEVPFDELLQTLKIDRALNHTPLFQVLFALQNAPIGKMDTGDLTITPLEPENSKAPFDLVLSMEEISTGIRGRFRYNSDLFEKSTIVRMGEHFENILKGVLKDYKQPVNQIALIGSGEKKRLLELRSGRREFPVNDSITGLIEKITESNTDAVAISFNGDNLTYGQLNAKADYLAGVLQKSGVKSADRVGICMTRSTELIISILAILKTGATYVPLDSTHPAERLSFIMDDAQIEVVLTDTESIEFLPSSVKHQINVTEIEFKGGDVISPHIEIIPSMVAYIIYTSGSTGWPKGVEISHANVIRLFTSTEELFNFGSDDVWTLFHSYAFDFSVWEIFGALIYGGRLVIVPYLLSRSPDAFLDLIQKESVTVLNQTPSAFRQLIEIDRRDGGRQTSLKYVIFGGEALDIQSLDGWCNRHGFDSPQLINMYGITETTVHVTYHRITKEDISGGVSKIGSPIPDLSIDLFDEYRNLVPFGVPGEILVGGAGLSSGYLNRPELTAQRFVNASEYGFEGHSKLYRSGDLARRYADGSLEYLGRIDQQVKIRGFRIELGEIESKISGFDGVSSVAVVVKSTDSGNELVGYVVFQQGIDGTKKLVELKEFLKQKLPEYMIPATICVLDEMPLTPNGKLDKKNLPDVERNQRSVVSEFVAPDTPLEKLLAKLWQEVLQISEIGIHDNFFELGGDSIKGAIFANKMQQEIGSVFYVVSIFEAPTIAGLIEYMRIHYSETVHKYEGTETNVSAAIKKLDESDLQKFEQSIIPLQAFPDITGKAKNRRAVFVLAPPRSGTTLLRVLLGGHSQLFAPPELELMPYNTLKDRREVNSGRDAFWLEGTIRAVMELRGIDADAAKALMEGYEEQDMSVMSFYGELQNWMDNRILVDKSPSYVLDKSILQRIEDTFQNPIYIHLHRHPRGMINSFVEAKLHQIFFRYPHNFDSTQLAELIWAHSHSNITEFLETIPTDRHLKVSFEDLTKSAGEEIEKICALIGIDFEPEMLAIYEKDARKKLMTDGIHKESKMLGDVKFHTHSKIDHNAAERWKKNGQKLEVSDFTTNLANKLGYGKPQNSIVRSAPTQTNASNKLEKQRQLSLSQQRLWFFDKLDGSHNTYNMPIAMWLGGKLDVKALIRSIEEIQNRHEVLRSYFVTHDGEPQCWIKESIPSPFVVDLMFIDEKNRLQEAEKWLDRESKKPFDLSTGPLFRAGIVKTDEQTHLLLINMHHIVSDGWSLGIVSKELELHYKKYSEGAEVDIHPLKLQYSDYADWQSKLLESGELDRQLDYWKSQLSDIPKLLELPSDRPRTTIKSYSGKTYQYKIEADLVTRFKKLAEKSGSTLYMALLTVFGLLMKRYSGQNIIPVGSPVSNRRNIDFEPLIGFFVNTLVMKVEIDDDVPFIELLKKVRSMTLEAYHNQDISFEQIVEEVQPERNLSYSPLFQVMFTMQTTGVGLPEFEGIRTELTDYDNNVSKYDLTLLFAEDNTGGLEGYFEYSTDLFDEWRIRQISVHFEELLRQVLLNENRSVRELPMMRPVEQNKILRDWNSTESDWSYDESLPALIRKMVTSNPEKTAITCGNQSLTYLELELRSNKLAHMLMSAGIIKHSLVAVALERSTDLVVAILGIIKAGCCYVPLDPGYPANRIEMIFEDAAIEFLLTQDTVQHAIPKCKNVILIEDLSNSSANWADSEPCIKIHEDDLAYVIFTSGSTGRPKGVMIPHKALLNFIFSMNREPGISSDDVLLAVTTIAFDIAVLEIWAPLVAGAEIVMATEIEVRDADALKHLMDEHSITILQATPATWRLLIDSGWMGSQNIKCLCGGEALPKMLAVELTERCREVWNMYGPTETTVWSTINLISNKTIKGSNASIGRPIANTSIYILDGDLTPLPAGIPGELYIGGHGVAAGYLNQPGLTSERFLSNPFDTSDKIYRTGDLAMYNNDGTIEYLGRSDLQVKIRGFRIELGEIEHQLQTHESVAQCSVVVAGSGLEARLLAFIIPEFETEVIEKDFKKYLSEKLPDYMVPVNYISVEEFPLTPNGKLDRKKLSELKVTDEKSNSTSTKNSAKDLTELRMLKVWQEILGSNNIGTDDNFFEIGGHSLIAVRLMSKITTEFGQTLPLASLFQHPTVSQMSKYLQGGAKLNNWGTLVPISKGKEGVKPIFCAPGAGGNILYLQSLSREIAKDIPIIGLQPPGLDGTTDVARDINELAGKYVSAILQADPVGPYRLCGHSFGGLVMFETARQLIQQNYTVEKLILLDTPAPQWVKPTGLDWSDAEWFTQIAQIAGHQYNVDLQLTLQDFHQKNSKEEQLMLLQLHLIICGVLPEGADINHLRGFTDVYRSNLQMEVLTPEEKIDVDVCLIRSADLQPDQISDKDAEVIRAQIDLGWGGYIVGSIKIIEVPGDHLTMLNPPNVSTLAENLNDILISEPVSVE
jgi:amino acid adenylation domain-containing protein